jgi:hypothetical protein
MFAAVKVILGNKKGGPTGVALAEKFLCALVSAHTPLSEGSIVGGQRIRAHTGSANRAARESGGCELGVDVEGAGHRRKPRKVELPCGTLTDTGEQFKAKR